ncbi:MAG: archease [Thermosphaera sp.]
MEDASIGLREGFEFLEHMSDIYVRARGRSLLELLENAGLALFEAMTDTSKLLERVDRAVLAEGFDLENLLYKWLENLLILYYSERLMCRKVRIEEFRIEKENGDERYFVKGVCRGDFFDPSIHEARVEIKSPTYSLMRIEKTADHWTAYFVLDI